MNRLLKEHKLKSIGIFLVILVAVIATVHTVLYFSVKNIIEEQIGLGAQTVAVSVASNVMENIAAYKQFVQTRDVNSSYYKEMQRYFNAIKAGSNIKFIYTEKKIDSETVEFILDSEQIGSADYSPPGSTTHNDWMRRTVYDNKAPAKFQAFEYPVWGNLIVAYAPIFDTNGELLGVVGANIATNELSTRLSYLNLIMISLYVAILAFITLILFKSSDFFLEKFINDKLTGAINKRYFEKIMKNEVADALRDNTHLTLFVFDLDHFKKVNDTYGHAFGDHVLSSISATIKKFMRHSDYFIRYGGEEFIMILPQVTLENARDIAERIRMAVESVSLYNTEKDTQVQVTISIGVTTLHSGQTVNAAQRLLHNADKALYEAKITRNSVAFFQE